MSCRALSTEAKTALAAALRDRPDVSRAFLAPRDGSIIVEFRETAEDIEEYKESVRDLMLLVVSSLGGEGRGRALQCGPAATIEPSIRDATLLYERAAG